MKLVIISSALLLLTFFSNAQTKTTKQQPFGSWSADLGYLISTNSTNTKNTKPIFGGNGINAGVNYRWGKTLGIKTTLGFNGGKTNEKEILSFAKTFETNGLTAVSSYSKSWNQLNLLVGPSYIIGKQGRLIFSGQFGIGYNLNSSDLKVDLFDANTFVKNAFSTKSKNLIPLWKIEGSYGLFKINNRFRCDVNAGVGTNGGTVGIAFSDIIRCCLECCRLCMCPPPPKGNK
ncbi:MAG: outer membrane beta-barrel protein [Chitinophagaceae bacterium]|nr:outer membrane beta-barrel protein [Chitinophagaceae bacterium]